MGVLSLCYSRSIALERPKRTCKTSFNKSNGSLLPTGHKASIRPLRSV
nr:MAG TPA: hypothetical protein [Caudoviricetes sp.]